MTRQGRKAAPSLRVTLLAAMVTVFAAVFGLEWLQASRTFERLANTAYDRSLAGALKSIDANISTESGGLAVELPYRLLELFELTASGPVYFRVATEDRLAEIGSADLPMPPGPLASGTPVFYEADYHGERLRVGALARPLKQRLYPTPEIPGPQRINIQVGEVPHSRESFARAALGQIVWRDLQLVFFGSLGIVMAVLLALRPLARVRRELAARSDDDLHPLDGDAVPAEVRPLVDALNQHIARYRRLADVQQHFLQDASHQLRTPLAVLRAQIDSALRSGDAAEQRESLQAMSAGVDRAARVTHQLLQLARTRDARAGHRRADFVRCDAAAVAQEVARTLLPLAHRRGIDFGFESDGQPLWLRGDPLMLAEALSNLVENAIRLTPSGGRVTVRAERMPGAGQGVRIGVEDDGPGMPPERRAEVGRRFAGHSPAGGLGLAIAHEVAELHGGRLLLADGPDGPDGRGLVAMLVLADETEALAAAVAGPVSSDAGY